MSGVQKADDKKLYTVTEGVRTEYNPDGTIKAENVRIYTEYELMPILGTMESIICMS